MVMNIMVEIETSTSARVSWDAIDFPGITGYIVYYGLTGNRKRQAEQSMDVPGSSANMVLIEDLVNGAEYQFTVVALANLDGASISGSRAMPIVMLIVLTTSGELRCTPIVVIQHVVSSFQALLALALL